MNDPHCDSTIADVTKLSVSNSAHKTSSGAFDDSSIALYCEADYHTPVASSIGVTTVAEKSFEARVCKSLAKEETKGTLVVSQNLTQGKTNGPRMSNTFLHKHSGGGGSRENE